MFQKVVVPNYFRQLLASFSSIIFPSGKFMRNFFELPLVFSGHPKICRVMMYQSGSLRIDSSLNKLIRKIAMGLLFAALLLK